MAATANSGNSEPENAETWATESVKNKNAKTGSNENFDITCLHLLPPNNKICQTVDELGEIDHYRKSWIQVRECRLEGKPNVHLKKTL